MEARTAIKNESDKQKAERIYKQYHKLMIYVSRQMIKDEHHVLDVVHDAFVKIMNNLHKIDESNPQKTRSYIVTICRNVCIDFLNKTNKESIDAIDNDSDDFVDPEGGVLDKFTSAESVELIMSLIDKIKPEYAELLKLKIILQCDDKELAKHIGISHDNLRKRLSRARKSLKDLIKKEGKK